MSSRHAKLKTWSPYDEPRFEVVSAIPEHCGASMRTDLRRAEFYCDSCGEVQDARFCIETVGKDDQEERLQQSPVYSGKPPIKPKPAGTREKALRLWKQGLRVREIAAILGLGKRGFETVQRWVALSRNSHFPQ